MSNLLYSKCSNLILTLSCHIHIWNVKYYSRDISKINLKHIIKITKDRKFCKKNNFIHIWPYLYLQGISKWSIENKRCICAHEDEQYLLRNLGLLSTLSSRKG